MLGKVVKNIADKFTVVGNNGEIYENCVARGNLKVNGKLFVGDSVEYDLQDNKCIINKINQRKNSFIRPVIANIDVMLLVVSEVPKVDYLLLDKLILTCKYKNVEPIIVINKQDIISESFIEDFKGVYCDSGVKIIIVSSITGFGKEELVDSIKGKLACLAGQSAVGKSSILNMLTDAKTKVGELSKKIERGKNTTRHAEIFFEKTKNLYLADTAGFSKLEIVEIPFNKIESYYDEFNIFRKSCYYKPCSHIFEKEFDCGVKCALNDCKINKNRYNNYKEIYLQTKNAWEKRYG